MGFGSNYFCGFCGIIFMLFLIRVISLKSKLSGDKIKIGLGVGRFYLLTLKVIKYSEGLDLSVELGSHLKNIFDKQHTMYSNLSMPGFLPSQKIVKKDHEFNQI